MEFIILVGAVVAVFGAMMITLALSPNNNKTATRSSIDPVANEASAESRLTGIQMAQGQKAEETPAPQPQPAQTASAPEPEPIAPTRFEEPVYNSLVHQQHDVMMPTHPLQLEATEIINTQIERLQAEYIRISEDRTRLAQELLTSWLIEKFEDTHSRLKTDTKREAQDLRQQLVKVSAEFERVEFRLASLQNLQYRLDDPRVTEQIDDLVYAVKQLARER